MNPPRRIELWLLLAAIAAGLVLVFATRHREDEPAAAAGRTPASSAEAPLKLYRCTLERDYGNARVDLELRVQNASGEKLVLQSPKVKLLGAKGREVQGFYLAFEQLPEIPPQATQDVPLRYWLEAADLQGAIQLEVEGHTIEVKSAKPFDLHALKNGEKKTFNAGSGENTVDRGWRG